MFSQRHYEFLAKQLQANKPELKDDQVVRYRAAHAQWLRTVQNLAASLAKDNEKFDRDRFYRAAGYYSFEPF